MLTELWWWNAGRWNLLVSWKPPEEPNLFGRILPCSTHLRRMSMSKIQDMRWSHAKTPKDPLIIDLQGSIFQFKSTRCNSNVLVDGPISQLPNLGVDGLCPLSRWSIDFLKRFCGWLVLQKLSLRYVRHCIYRHHWMKTPFLGNQLLNHQQSTLACAVPPLFLTSRELCPESWETWRWKQQKSLGHESPKTFLGISLDELQRYTAF